MYVNAVDALSCIHFVFLTSGQPWARLTWFFNESKCGLITESPLYICLSLPCFVCQTLPWSQTWKTCQPIWGRQPSYVVKPWQFLQPHLSGSEMTTGETTDKFLAHLFDNVHPKPAGAKTLVFFPLHLVHNWSVLLEPSWSFWKNWFCRVDLSINLENNVHGWQLQGWS